VTIWVTFAVPFESAAFRRQAASRGVRILHTGVGTDAARVTLEQALCEAENPPELVLVSGFAGGLLPELRIGEIVTDHEEMGSRWRRAIFAQADEVLATAAAKREFRERTGAEVVDMETAAIREVCAAAGVPKVVAIRAISDGAKDDLGVPPDLLEDLARRPVKSAPRLLAMLVTNAERRKAFLTLMRNCKTAQQALAVALESAIRDAMSGRSFGQNHSSQTAGDSTREESKE
jgi:nucleoside phosphorylase